MCSAFHNSLFFLGCVSLCSFFYMTLYCFVKNKLKTYWVLIRMPSVFNSICGPREIFKVMQECRSMAPSIYSEAFFCMSSKYVQLDMNLSPNKSLIRAPNQRPPFDWLGRMATIHQDTKEVKAS
jgi:hypothetical protein